MDRKRITVKTPLGNLAAEIGGDPDYPEIFLYLEREDNTEIDLVAVGYDYSHKDKISAYLYEDTTRDDWTKKHCWSKEELEVDMDNEGETNNERG